MHCVNLSGKMVHVRLYSIIIARIASFFFLTPVHTRCPILLFDLVGII